MSVFFAFDVAAAVRIHDHYMTSKILDLCHPSTDNGTYSLISRNCAVHKVANSHQDAICHGLHDRIIDCH